MRAARLMTCCLLLFSCAFAQRLPLVAPPDQEGPSDSPLIRALVKGDKALARQLVEVGEPLNRKDRWGSTPLVVAISMHHSDFAEFLVQKGADVNLTAGGEESPLKVAAGSCDLRVARLLLEQGAKVNYGDQHGVTPLSSAAGACKDRDLIKLLITSGAEINTRYKYGTTPLMAASSNRNLPAVQELLRAGADVTARNDKGETAEDQACRRGGEDYSRICTLLRKAKREK